MSDAAPSEEQKILQAVKLVLTMVVKDTATPPGMKHPLSDKTISAMRDGLAMISSREMQLIMERGEESLARPHYVDEKKSQTEVVVSIDSIKNRR